MPGKNRKWSVGVIALVSLCLVAFVSYKATHTSFTHDESFTTLHFFPQSEINILFYRHPYTSVITNNHIFNTYMMKLSESLFGFSEWALRLPNILSLVSYLFFAFALLRPLQPLWMQLFAFLLLVANPYLLDFFGLARGYGLSIGLMMGSLYYLIRFLNQETGRSLFAFHLMGVLSVMSNFALLNFYVLAIGCLYGILLLSRSAGRRSLLNSWRFHGWNMLAVLITAGLLYAPFKVILANNTVSFGGKQGFFTDTILSVVRRSMYETELSDTLLKGLGYLVCFLVIFPTIIVLIRLIRQRLVFLKHFTALAVCNALCLGIALLTTVQHYLLGQDFLMDRFAVFLYPLFILNVIFFLDWMWQQKPGKKMAFAGMLALTLIMTLHTASKLNTDFYLNWKYDKDTKSAMEVILQHKPAATSSRKIKIGVFHKLEPTMNLYRRWWKLDWIETFDRDPPESTDDFVFMLESELPSLGIEEDREILFRSEENKLVLLKVVDDKR